MSEYPDNWKEIADDVKDRAGWRCVRCGHAHVPEEGYCLTVHHADNIKSNNVWWNLIPLCQRCHLHVQAKVKMNRIWMFEHSEWFKPYVAGYYASLNSMDYDREFVENNADSIIEAATI